jgi:RNA polymerase sigma-70 factor, ECF subfamily
VPPAERSDHELLASMAAEDATAFPELVARWRPRLVNFLRSRGADPDGADDVAQETLVRVHGYRHSYRPDAPFTAFLFTVARNALADHRRSRARHRDREEGPAGLDDVPARGAPTSGALRLDLEDALERLPERLRKVVELGAVRGLPYEVVGTLLGIPVGTVKSRMFHALRALRERLDPR